MLFDIDGTLLLSGGAGVRAMTRAFEAHFGVARAFEGIRMAGRTDSYLLSLALANHGLADTPEAHAAFRAAYVRLLAEAITEPGHGRRGVLAGVEPLLAALHARNDCHLALLTGNYEAAAGIKLGHFGLRRFFAWGVFGEESADRNVLGRLAMERARQRGVPDAARAKAIVVGDTPDDIACARAAGLRAMAVATGSYSIHELEAAGADVTFADLSDTDAVLAGFAPP